MKTVLLIVLLAIIGCSDKSTEVNESKKLAPKDFVEVFASSPDEALSYLNSLDLKFESEIPQMYLSMFKSHQLKESFLTRKKFNATDLFYFKQAFTFADLSKKIKAENKEEEYIKACYNLTRARINGTFEGKDQSAFPISIWQRGYGVCDRQSWVLCELAYQLGADVYVIYLKNPKTGISHHTICEVRFKEKSYLLDPLYGKFLENQSIRDLTDDQIKEIWPEHPTIHGDFEKSVVFNPCMPHDYALRFQALAKYVSEKYKIYPRFGEDPKTRGKRRKFSKEEMFIFWGYPLRLLKVLKIYNATEK